LDYIERLLEAKNLDTNLVEQIYAISKVQPMETTVIIEILAIINKAESITDEELVDLMFLVHANKLNND
jgi:hypothetical protein